MANVTLPPDLEAWARAEVEAGRAESVEALVADAVSEHKAEVEYVRAKLDEARASIAAGRTITLDEFMARNQERIDRLRALAKAAE